MSEDPISKSKIGPGMGGDPISKGKGRGSINVSKDYSTAFTSLGSRIAFITFCLLPYIAICVFVYLEGLEALGLMLLAVPLLLFLLFWFVSKKTR